MAEEEEYYYSDAEDDGAAGAGPASPRSSQRAAASASSSSSSPASPRRATAARAAGAGAGSGVVGGGGGAAGADTGPLGVGSAGGDLIRLTEAEIALRQNQIIREVAGLLDIPPECARTALIYFKWSKDKLFDKYYANPKGVRAEIGIAHLGVAAPSPVPFACQICLEDCRASDGFGLGCRHVFCRSCWSGFLSAAVSDEGANCIFKKCPAEACGEAVTMSVVHAMAPPDVAAKWAVFELKHFVTISKDMAWCPGAGCSNAFVARAAVKTATCSCGTRFCFKCSREAHQPVDCANLGVWLEKCGNESETANWILANTKKCPLCAVRIEKNQGCNHIKCTNKGCRFEFCWTCLGPWTDHGQSTGGYYKCNKFKTSSVEEMAGMGDAAKAKAELDKYLFYYQRYTNHEQAGRFAAKHREAAAKRMEELQATSATASWSDVTFLEDATLALLECRRTLKYTYVMGYYMKEGAEKRLFEHLQEHLEKSTEHLAELTEAPLEKMDRAQVLNYSSVTQRFLRNLLTGVEEGLTSQV